MKIAVIHNLPSGGAKRIIYEQVRGLVQRGHQIVEFAPSTADLGFCSLSAYASATHVFPLERVTFRKERIPLVTPYIHTVEGLRWLHKTENLYRAIAERVDQDGFDLAYVQDCQISMKPAVLKYLRTASIVQCCHAHRTQVWTVSLHTQEHLIEKLKSLYYSPARAILQSRFLRNERKNVRSAFRVLVLSRHARQVLLEHYGAQSYVLYPGINTEMFFPRMVDKENFVLCVAALEYHKGYRFLISALAEIEASRRPRLLIVANSINPEEERIVRRMAVESGVSVHIESINNDPERLAKVYSQAAVFIYAPLKEALGLAPLEALACGTPVIAVAEAGVQETLMEGAGAWLVSRDKRLFADRLAALLSNDKERAQMGKTGVEYVRKRWSWEENIAQLEKHFDEVQRLRKPTLPSNSVIQ